MVIYYLVGHIQGYIIYKIIFYYVKLKIIYSVQNKKCICQPICALGSGNTIRQVPI